MKETTAIIAAHGPDREGLVAAITQWIFDHRGNILHLDQHVDPVAEEFFIRVEWDLKHCNIPFGEIPGRWETDLGQPLELAGSVTVSGRRPRVALFVSKLGHCFWDLLARCEAGEWGVDVPLIIGNHDVFAETARQRGYSFCVLPVAPETKADQEQRSLELLQEHQIDLVVFARYMQIVTDTLIVPYRDRIINIHHSFLPAFAGARPYHRAYERGVKVIGATAHYVTEDLDEGPIIAQDTVPVSHRDTVEDMIRKGRDLEKVVLARAVNFHLNHQVIVHGNRTVVFG